MNYENRESHNEHIYHTEQLHKEITTKNKKTRQRKHYHPTNFWANDYSPLQKPISFTTTETLRLNISTNTYIFPHKTYINPTPIEKGSAT